MLNRSVKINCHCPLILCCSESDSRSPQINSCVSSSSRSCKQEPVLSPPPAQSSADGRGQQLDPAGNWILLWECSSFCCEVESEKHNAQPALILNPAGLADTDLSHSNTVKNCMFKVVIFTPPLVCQCLETQCLFQIKGSPKA